MTAQKLANISSLFIPRISIFLSFGSRALFAEIRGAGGRGCGVSRAGEHPKKIFVARPNPPGGKIIIFCPLSRLDRAESGHINIF